MALSESQMYSLYRASTEPRWSGTNTVIVTPLICIKKNKKTYRQKTVLIPRAPNTLLFFCIYLFEYMVHRLSPLNLSSYLVQSHTPLAACLLYTPLWFCDFFPGQFKVCATVCVRVLWALSAQLLDVVIADSRASPAPFSPSLSALRLLTADSSHQHCGVCLQERRPSRQVYERRRAGYTLINLTDAWCVITFHLLLFSHSSLYREPL